MINLISFASSNIKKSQQRLIKQSREMRQINQVKIYDEKDLDDEFRNSYKNILREEIKGYGYWIWKPYIIYRSLMEGKLNDNFLYLDVGCHLNSNGKRIFDEYLEKLNSSQGVLGFQAKSTLYFKESIDLLNYRESAYTKGDVFDHFGVRYMAEIVSSPQIGAGVIFIKNNDFSREIVRTWLNTVFKNVGLFDDTKSKSANFSDFISHRHDQSIFSILAKIYKVETNSSLEYWYPSEPNIAIPDWDKLKNFPIHAKRDIKYKIKTKILKISVRLLKHG